MDKIQGGIQHFRFALIYSRLNPILFFIHPGPFLPFLLKASNYWNQQRGLFMIKPMKKFLLILWMIGAAPVGAQMVPVSEAPTQTMTPTVVPVMAAPMPQATPQTPGMPLVYFSLGAGTALIGNGFGTEGNPWNDTGADTLANGFGTSFNPSEALIVLIGLNLDAKWSFNLSLENYSFVSGQGSTSSSSNEENLIPSLRYVFDSGWFAPYVSAGFGFNFNTTSAAAPASVFQTDSGAQVAYNTQSVSNGVASGGVGLLFKIAGDQSGHAFLEAQYQQVFTAQGGFSYYPISIGYQYP